MSMTPEVETAIQELREHHPDAVVTATPDDQGGAFVKVNPVDLGEKYTPRKVWVRFQLTFQYPGADVYPHFIPPDVRRTDGKIFPEGQPLGEATSNGSFVFGVNAATEPAIQVSRRSNRLNPATDTAALKLEKVLAWLRGR